MKVSSKNASQIRAQSPQGKALTLFVAAFWGRKGDIEVLLKTNPELVHERSASHAQKTPLMVAAESGHLGCVRLLLPYSDPLLVDEAGNSALMLAALREANACIQPLLPHSHARAVNIDGESALMLAAEAADAETLRLLLPHSDPLHKGGSIVSRDALMLAARRGDGVELVKALLPHSDARARSSTGETALMYSAQMSDWASLQLLLPHSDVTAVDNQDCSAFDFAVKQRAWGCIDRLAAWQPIERLNAVWTSASEEDRSSLPQVRALLEREILGSILPAQPANPIPTLTTRAQSGPPTGGSLAGREATDSSNEASATSGTPGATNPGALRTRRGAGRL